MAGSDPHGARRESAVQRRLRQRVLHGLPATAAARRPRRTQRSTHPRGQSARAPSTPTDRSTFTSMQLDPNTFPFRSSCSSPESAIDDEGARASATGDEAQEQSSGAGQQRHVSTDSCRHCLHHLSDACPRHVVRRLPSSRRSRSSVSERWPHTDPHNIRSKSFCPRDADFHST